MYRRLAAVAAAASSFGICALAIRRRKRAIRKPQRALQPRYRRAALLPPISSRHTTAWRQILSCGTSSDFLVTLNLDRSTALEVLLPLFEQRRPSVNFGSPYRRGIKRRGRNCTVTSIDILGLVLCYLKSSCRQMALSPMFGLVLSSVQVWIDYGMEVLDKVLRDKSNIAARVSWPTEAEMKESSLALMKNRPNGRMMKGIFAVVDGGRVPCAHYTDCDMQNAYYEGYTGNVEVTNLLVFNFFGEIIHAGVNFPGSWHDSKLASLSGLIYPKLSDEMTPHGYAILGDSAFVSSMRTGFFRVKDKVQNGGYELSKARLVDCDYLCLLFRHAEVVFFAYVFIF